MTKFKPSQILTGAMRGPDWAETSKGRRGRMSGNHVLELVVDDTLDSQSFIGPPSLKVVWVGMFFHRLRP